MEALTPIQNQALCLLAAGHTIDEVVAETGVGKRTLSRWKTTCNFKKLLQDAVTQTYDSAVAELVSGSREAARELKRIISDPDVPSKTKVTAINVLLNNAARAKESALEERLERLEESFDGTHSEQN
ncbi:hypothetical protein HW132_28720 [Brasilonema sp. CT11]|nr:hypothetical protein [Brasilonema sp. CT11]